LKKFNYTIDNEGYRHAHSCVVRADKISGGPLPHLKEQEVAVLADETVLTFTHPYSHVRSTFRRLQLPITPAFALTAHKSQGNTLQSAILDLEICFNIEAVYVMLSLLTRKCFLLGFAGCNISRAIPVVRWGTIAIVLSCTIIP